MKRCSVNHPQIQHYDCSWRISKIVLLLLLTNASFGSAGFLTCHDRVMVPPRLSNARSLPPRTRNRLFLQSPMFGSIMTDSKTTDHHLSKKTTHTRCYQQRNYWDGDDIRWTSRFLRRVQRKRWRDQTNQTWTPGRNSLVVIFCLLFTYQVVNTISAIRIRYPRQSQGMPAMMSLLWDICIRADTCLHSGPLTWDFAFSRGPRQPHRLVTSGFLHANLLHMLWNVYSLTKLVPRWLETGLGTSRYLSAFVFSVLMGNLGHWYGLVEGDPRSLSTIGLGASAGICGLLGMQLISLVRIKSSSSSSSKNARVLDVIKSLGLVILVSWFFPTLPWNTYSHIGGFVGGMFFGLLCAPQYKTNYSMRRKWSLEVDVWPKDYRNVMGFGISPSSQGFVPIWLFWIGTILAGTLIFQQKALLIPLSIVQALLKPGSLSPSNGIGF